MQLGKKTKRSAICGLLIAVSLIFSFVESMVPINFALYGFKIGLANIVVVFSLYKLSLFDAFVICTAKIFISGLLFGGPVYMFYSLCGGLLSYLIMAITKRNLNIITVSVLGAVSFNIGQIICACFMFSTIGIVTYLPVLLLIGLFTGILIGIISKIAVERINI